MGRKTSFVGGLLEFQSGRRGRFAVGLSCGVFWTLGEYLGDWGSNSSDECALAPRYFVLGSGSS
jgi:hypothetical protein